MKNRTTKGLVRRTLHLYTQIQIPWILYVLQVFLGFVSTKVAYLYVPYETSLQLGNVEDITVVWKYVGFMLLTVVVSMADQLAMFYAGYIVGRNVQNKMLARALRLPMRSYEIHASQMVGWITNDCTVADGLITSMVGFVTGIYSAYLGITKVAEFNTSLVYIIPFVMAYILFSTWLAGRLLFLREKRDRTASAELMAYLAEHLSFAAEMRQLNTRQEEVARGRKAIQDNYNAQIYQAVLTVIGSLVSGSLTRVISILVLVLGVSMVNRGEISIEELVNFQSYVLLAYGALELFPDIYTSFMLYGGKLYYIAGLLDEKEEVYQRERTMDVRDEDICFENVTFGYGDKPVLQNVSFTIPKGKVTALVGPNGSGKTTVFKLIERFYTPDSGKITFGPYDAECFHLNEWRQSMAYVLQEPQIFSGTVRDNINYGLDREATEEDTVEAAKLACADGFIRELPGGYDFDIGENGCRLSAGQRQRIAIARAVMLDPAYLLLDEATCNMDVYAEQEVTEALLHLMEGRTTVMISHDMDALKNADHVIVINGGTLEAEGTLQEAQAGSETLRRMIQASR